MTKLITFHLDQKAQRNVDLMKPFDLIVHGFIELSQLLINVLQAFTYIYPPKTGRKLIKAAGYTAERTLNTLSIEIRSFRKVGADVINSRLYSRSSRS